jgi:hypothetical protein
LNRTTKLIRLPFRVFNLVEFEKYIYLQKKNIYLQSEIKNEISNSHENNKDKFNPFLIIDKSEFENLEYAVQILDDICARMSTSKHRFKL